MTKTALVIGAGITGVCTAEWLRRAGVKVTLIDRIEPGDPAQTSYGNAGLLARVAIGPIADASLLRKAPMMLLDPDSPLFLKWSYLPKLIPWIVPFIRNMTAKRIEEITAALLPLTEDSVDQHIALATGTSAAQYIRTGDYFYYYRDRAAFDKDRAHNDLLRRAGFTVIPHDRAQMLAIDPAISPAYSYAAAHPDHGWLTSPGKYVAALADHFRAAGGEFKRGEVVNVTNTTVTLQGGEVLTADKIILAAGAWSGPLAKQLGQKSLLETERGYHLFLNGASYVPPHPFMVSDAKFVVTPMEGGLRCAGIVEFGGLTAPRSTAPIALLKKRIRQVYPDLTWDTADEWMGFRPSTPDSLPHIGALPDAPNVIVAFGSQHIGITIGPRLGRMAADIALGKRSNIDLTPYAPDRFR